MISTSLSLCPCIPFFHNRPIVERYLHASETIQPAVSIRFNGFGINCSWYFRIHLEPAKRVLSKQKKGQFDVFWVCGESFPNALLSTILDFVERGLISMPLSSFSILLFVRKKWVDNGMNTGDASFINGASGIVNRGCHNPPNCGTGELHAGVAWHPWIFWPWG